MSAERKRALVRVGVRQGGGPPPGYRWWIEYFTVADGEARKLLSDVQLDYVLEQVRDLATCTDPRRPATQDVRSIDDYFELRLKYAVLGRMNLRVFFWVDDQEDTIVVLGVWKKENEDQTPKPVKITIARRLRVYRAK